MLNEHVPSWIQSGLTSEFALLFLLGVFVLEGAMLLYVIPSELIVPASLLLIGDSYLLAALIIGVAVVGATIGQTILFTVARKVGRERILASRWIPINDDQLTRFEDWFETYGAPAVPVTNSLLFVRGMLTVPAGLSDMRYSRFVLLSAAGTLVFETALAALYYVGVIILF